MRAPRALAAAVAVSYLSVSACDGSKKPADPAPATSTAAAASAEPSKPAALDRTQLAAFAPLPAKIERPDNVLTDEKVALGRMLFFDVRLSRGHDVACSSCHDPSKAGADGIALAVGTKKANATRNTPTIFNAAGGASQGWDGRGALVEDFVVTHAADSAIMASDEARLVSVVSSIPGYVAAFKKAFPEEKGVVSGDTLGKAVAAYARKLLTPSRWDAFLGGKDDALTPEEKEGLAAFLDASCVTCHAGKYVGAAQNQKLGIAKPWPGAAGSDPGRQAVTNDGVDKGVFKVPSLRNVAKTAPYLHDGSIASLEEVTRLMARHQVGRELADARVKAIVTFMGALSGDAPAELLAKPALPPSGPKTPKPD